MGVGTLKNVVDTERGECSVAEVCRIGLHDARVRTVTLVLVKAFRIWWD